MDEEAFLISELAQRSGVSTRTIRYYIAEDLLPPPPIKGRYSYFTSEYIDRIRLIKHLQDTYLPLKEIRRQMQNLTSHEVKELLNKFDKTSSPESKMLLQPNAPKTEASDTKNTEEQTGSALEYINHLLQTRKISEKKEEQEIYFQRLSQRPSPPPSPQGKTWRRIPLAPGLELHVEQLHFQRYEHLIQQIHELVKKHHIL